MADMTQIAPVIEDSFSGLHTAIEALSIPKHRAMLVADSNTVTLFGEAVQEELAKVFTEVRTFVFEAGEEHKTLNSVTSLLAYLIDSQYDRKDTIVALGGGVTGDMAGFAASIFLRGIPVIQLPTTLLAQVDSSIGGKTGVDFDGYKNMIGAFHMPALVYTNSSALETLPEDQFISGMGEVIKSALLRDKELYHWLKANRDQILARDHEALLHMIRCTAGIKTAIVQADPTEKGERALLNLGHTIGHAVEKAMNFSMAHGECVGVGMAAAAQMSFKRGLISQEDLDDILKTCASFGLPLTVSGLDAEEVLRLTKSDKKMSQGQIRFVLLRQIGEAFYTDDVTDEELMDGIRFILNA